MTIKNRGFTLIEMLVAVVIIGLLATASTITIQRSIQHGRDTRRKADLSTVADALEKYYYNRRIFPQTSSANPNKDWFSDFDPTSVGCNRCQYQSLYIPDLAPDYISKLPQDPKFIASSGRGYMYSSPLGQNYKLVSFAAVESVDSVPSTDEYYDTNSTTDINAQKSFQISSLGGKSFYWQ